MIFIEKESNLNIGDIFLSCFRSILPLVLAQLLIQFQKPIVSEMAVQNKTNASLNDILLHQFNTSVIERSIRAVNDENYFQLIQKSSSTPMIEQNDLADEVKNVSYSNNTLLSGERDQFRHVHASFAGFHSYFNHIWNDVYWLAHLVIWMGFCSVLLQHHYDLRLQMVGAKMRIACCSMMYRKVNKILNFLFIRINCYGAFIFSPNE